MADALYPGLKQAQAEYLKRKGVTIEEAQQRATQPDASNPKRNKMKKEGGRPSSEEETLVGIFTASGEPSMYCITT